jgi:hypothetical protein
MGFNGQAVICVLGVEQGRHADRHPEECTEFHASKLVQTPAASTSLPIQNEPKDVNLC